MAEVKKVWRQGKGHAVTVRLGGGKTMQLSTMATTPDAARAEALSMAAQLEAAAPSSTAAPAPAVSPPPPVNAPPPAPVPVGVNRAGDAFRRYAPAAAQPAAPAAAPAAAKPAAAPGELTYDPQEQAELAKMLGRVFSSVNKGAVGWSVRMLGKRPEPPSDEEEKVIDKAWAMQVKRWSRGKEISPILVIVGASVGMGIGMYRDGEPLPDTRPDAEVHPLRAVPPSAEPEKKPPSDAS